MLSLVTAVCTATDCMLMQLATYHIQTVVDVLHAVCVATIIVDGEFARNFIRQGNTRGCLGELHKISLRRQLFQRHTNVCTIRQTCAAAPSRADGDSLAARQINIAIGVAGNVHIPVDFHGFNTLSYIHTTTVVLRRVTGDTATTPFDAMITFHGNTAAVGIGFVTGDAATTHLKGAIHVNAATVGGCLVAGNRST